MLLSDHSNVKRNEPALKGKQSPVALENVFNMVTTFPDSIYLGKAFADRRAPLFYGRLFQ